MNEELADRTEMLAVGRRDATREVVQRVRSSIHVTSKTTRYSIIRPIKAKVRSGKVASNQLSSY
jgi:hypothetical protein